MALTLLRAYRAAADVGLGGLGVAAAPSGGFYLTESSTAALLARIAADGTISWKKELTYTGVTSIASGAAASNATHVALVFPYMDGSLDERINVSLYDSAGTLVWQNALQLTTSGNPLPAGRVAMRSDNDIAVLANSTGLDRADLQLLDGSAGALSWSANLAPSSGSIYVGFIQFLSGGDIVVLTRTTSTQYLQRLSGSDGSVVWSRSINWALGSNYGLAVDTSDNIYAWGPASSGSNGPELPVVKVDSSGTTVWSKLVRSPSSQADPMQFVTAGRGMAGASGAYIPCLFSTADERVGHVFVPENGTDDAKLTYFTRAGTTPHDATSFGESGAQITMSFGANGTSYEEALLLSDLNASGDDGTYGDFTRATTTFNMSTSSVSLSNSSYTRGAQFYDSPVTPVTASSATDSLAVEAIEVPSSYAAASITSTVAFGTPVATPIYVATGFSTTALGLPSLGFYATGSAFATTFGTPVLELDSTREATGLGSTVAFGLPQAVRGLAPAPHYATGIPAGAQFGEATLSVVFTGLAAGSADTVFGTPRVQLFCVATGLAVGALGTPTLRLPCRATGLAPGAAFGLPTVASFGSAAGFSTTRFGAHTARWEAVLDATGFSGTAFGTPSALKNAQRARSGVFRTRFGLAQCERTAP